MKRILSILLLLAPALAQAQAQPARSILFVGNSFTQGSHSAVKTYRADTVTDLNGEGIGGVPALFKAFAEQKGQSWKVALETAGGQSLAFHHDERRQRISGRYDAVVLQEYSVLDPNRPGDPTNYRKYALLLAGIATRANPDVQVLLMATWSRADLVYKPGSRWSGKPVETMALDLRRAADDVDRASPQIDGVLPVGEAWNRAMARGFADPNPYDGLTARQVNLWADDHYHASIYGSYLEALVVFGKVTGLDPKTLGPDERAAADLGISREQAAAMQAIASDEIAGR